MDAPPATGTTAAPAVGTATSRSRRRGRSATALIHAGLLAVAVAALASHEMGPTVHSLAGLVLAGAVVWHVRSHRRWVRSASRRRLAHPERVLVAWNAVLAVTLAAVTLSGLPVWLGDDRGVVLRLHDVTAIALIPLVLGHLVLNRHRLAARLRSRAAR